MVLGLNGSDCHNVVAQEERNSNFKISLTGGDRHAGMYR